jgi:hypothetical protein
MNCKKNKIILKKKFGNTKYNNHSRKKILKNVQVAIDSGFGQIFIYFSRYSTKKFCSGILDLCNINFIQILKNKNVNI